MSRDPEQDYFADGIVEEIITGLSRLRWLYVAARTSSFQFRRVKSGKAHTEQMLSAFTPLATFERTCRDVCLVP
jgi:TolB-like protein